MGKVIETAISSEVILETIRNDLCLDADTVFDSIDDFKLGYVSSGVFTRWVLDHCGYRISEDEVTYILNRYDKDGDYRIKRDEFLSETIALQEPKPTEEEEEDQYSQE